MSSFHRFITYSSLFIAFCAWSLAFFYTVITHTPVNFYRLSIVFLGTLISYNAVQLIPMDKNTSVSERSHWIRKNKKLLYSFVIFSFAAVLFCIPQLETFEIFNFTHLFILVLFYEKIFLKEKELRKIPYIKPFLISYIWACVCTVPEIYLNLSHPNFIIWPECFFFILGLTIPFDIRDVEVDRLDNVITFATKFQINHVKILSSFFFLLGLCLQFSYLELTGKNIFITIAIAGNYFFYLSKVRPNQTESIFLLGLDGIILLKLLYLL